jgi:hypothetical protein
MRHDRHLHMYKRSVAAAISADPLFHNLVDRNSRPCTARGRSFGHWSFGHWCLVIGHLPGERPRISFHFPNFLKGNRRNRPKRRSRNRLLQSGLKASLQKLEKGSATSPSVQPVFIRNWPAPPALARRWARVSRPRPRCPTAGLPPRPRDIPRGASHVAGASLASHREATREAAKTLWQQRLPSL